MNELKNDGGYAFPVWELNGKGQPEMTEFGMTLRDYFAAKAMQGLLAAQIHGFNDRPAKGPFASMAYEMADAMLKEREDAARQPTADQFIATFRCENNGIVGTKEAKIHSVTRHDDGCIEVIIDHWPEQRAAHPAISHCDKCGCDWLDNGLNPVGCPYCKNSDTAQQHIVSVLAEALEMMVEMVEMNGFGRAAAMDVARAALDAYRMVKE